MKKNEVTRATVNSLYDKVFRAGYCDLQHIFYNKSRRGYNSGIYGWNFDLYTTVSASGDIIAFTTGYRNMCGERVPGDIIEKYDKAARTIIESREPYSEKEKKLDANRAAFVAELLEQ